MIAAVIALVAQVVQAPTAATSRSRDTATYASAQLKAIIEDAVRFNRLVPPGLGAYRAQMESEISIGSQRPDKGERAYSVEQVASELAWNRTGAFEQHVIGYRSQAMGLQFATIGFMRNAWAVPSLYGNRLALLFGRDTTLRDPPLGRQRTYR